MIDVGYHGIVLVIAGVNHVCQLFTVYFQQAIIVENKQEDENMARPTRHGENKAKKTVYITDGSWEALDKIADSFMLSRSELFEMVGQGRLTISHKKSQAA